MWTVCQARHMRQLRKAWMNLSRVGSCVAALAILYSEVLASMGNKHLLFGVSGDHEVTNAYKSVNMPSFLSAIEAAPDTSQTMFESLSSPFNNHTTLPPSVVVAYLDTSGVMTNTCLPPVLAADYLYDKEYIQLLLEYTLANLANASTTAPRMPDPTNVFVIVDCSFDGRVLGDTTVVKVYLFDKGLTTVSTLLVQTMSISRPSLHLLKTGGVAMISTTPLAALRVNPTTEAVTSAQDATYVMSVGFSFPYDWHYFEWITLDELIPATGQWQATVVSTGERFTFAGTTGTFRDSPFIQGNFDYYYWQLPPDPIAFLTSIQYYDVFVFKDQWGWFRCFLGLGIGFNIGINTVVALLVMVHRWHTKHKIWVPDLYPSIQQRAYVRAILLLVDCLINNWWYPYTFAMNQGSYRTNWGGTLDLEEIPRADGLMICLAITYGAARLVHVRVELFIVVAVYAACYYNRFTIINRYGVCVDRANAIIQDNYFGNILPGNGGMDLWAYREEVQVHLAVIANELTWLMVAVGFSLSYTIAVKCLSMRHEIASTMSWPWSSNSNSRASTFTKIKVTATGDSNPNPRACTSTKIKGATTGDSTPATSQETSKHWSRRSILYETLSLAETENTQVERSVGVIVSHMTGFVAATKDYVIHRTTTQPEFVSPSGVWLLGYVIVHDRLLVGINDFVFLLANIVCQRTLVRIYGFELQGDMVSTHKQQIYPHDISVLELSHVSLKKLR
ncbi:Aste57867_1862 [Aphanomyces stellatus]|uniref:Aste57867_1862 protein n=1 Tax=Aphanomyces stellatus TaxID=120398 RepID=A0A485KAH6_9STRA|nr:hypothetical protein As57867_001860 [Aphanomyces stellatus]VFT79069.1 Aste57867_1862 [Aphanomyces stellatus]